MAVGFGSKALHYSNRGDVATIDLVRQVAQRELMPTDHHNTARYADNRAEKSHEPTRFRERARHNFSNEPCCSI